jgi:hypothetical protein
VSFGWTLVCPECYGKPGRHYGVLKIPNEPIDMACPNCGTRLIDIRRMKQRYAVRLVAIVARREPG